MSNKLTILVDMDSIMVNLQKEWYRRYNADYDDNLTPDDILTWDTHLYVKPECRRKIYSYFTPEMFRSLEPIDGAIGKIKKWKKQGHHVYIVSAPPWGCADAKYEWMREYAPFITSRDIILAHPKFLVKGDVLIDDSPNNISKYRQAWPESKIFTIAYAYNKDVEDLTDIRAGSWDSTEEAWEEFDKQIEILQNASK